MAHELADRLEKLAQSLRAQGLIHGPERDLMIDAANVLRAQRAQLIELFPLAEVGAIDLLLDQLKESN